MKKAIIIMLIAALLAASVPFSGCGGNSAGLNKSKSVIRRDDGTYVSKYGQISMDEWKKLDYEGNRFKSPEEFLEEVDYYVDTISKYIGKENLLKESTTRIIFFSTDGISKTVGTFDSTIKNITLNSKMFRLNMAPLAHEITHLLAPGFNSHSLGEGFPCFIQDLYGKNSAGQNFGAPVMSLSKEYINNKRILDIIGMEGDPMATFTSEERAVFYLLSHSFTKYLIDEYGIEKFLKLYNSKDLYSGYETQYRKTVEELKTEWISCVNREKAFECSYREWVEKVVK